MVKKKTMTQWATRREVPKPANVRAWKTFNDYMTMALRYLANINEGFKV